VSASVEVRFLPGPFVVEVEPGSTLLAAARKANAPLEAPCDGAGICGKCLVRLNSEALAALDVANTATAPFGSLPGSGGGKQLKSVSISGLIVPTLLRDAERKAGRSNVSAGAYAPGLPGTGSLSPLEEENTSLCGRL